MEIAYIVSALIGVASMIAVFYLAGKDGDLSVTQDLNAYIEFRPRMIRWHVLTTVLAVISGASLLCALSLGLDIDKAVFGIIPPTVLTLQLYLYSRNADAVSYLKRVECYRLAIFSSQEGASHES